MFACIPINKQGCLQYLLNNMKKLLALAVLCLLFNSLTVAKKFKEGEKPSWAKKDIRDFNDADMERLLEQWEVGSRHTAVLVAG